MIESKNTVEAMGCEMKKADKNVIDGFGINAESKLTVQKSKPLLALWQSNLTLSEFKILDTYLARINSRKPEERTVQFSRGEIEKVLGVTKINKSDLLDRLSRLSTPIDLYKGSRNKFHTLTLFEEAEGEQDENGFWQVQMTCTQSAMKYIFNIEEIGYLRYKLRCITHLTSRYTYILFIYLESNRYRKTWEVPLSELKEILNCHQEKLYSEFWRFNERILKRCQTELHQKTECRFSYEPVKRGRSVVSIRFTVETLSDLYTAISDISEFTDTTDTEQYQYTDDDIAFYAEACKNHFSQIEMEFIMSVVRRKELIPASYGIAGARYSYLAEKYIALERIAELKKARGNTPINDMCKYLVSMIEDDIKKDKQEQ